MAEQHKILAMSKHARRRMAQRGITGEEINAALQTGNRESKGQCVLHYDLRTRVAVLVDWRAMTVVTVLNLCKAHYHRLRALDREQAE